MYRQNSSLVSRNAFTLSPSLSASAVSSDLASSSALGRALTRRRALAAAGAGAVIISTVPVFAVASPFELAFEQPEIKSRRSAAGKATAKLTAAFPRRV
jgi:hypothetical protein